VFRPFARTPEVLVVVVVVGVVIVGTVVGMLLPGLELESDMLVLLLVLVLVKLLGCIELPCLGGVVLLDVAIIDGEGAAVKVDIPSAELLFLLGTTAFLWDFLTPPTAPPTTTPIMTITAMMTAILPLVD